MSSDDNIAVLKRVASIVRALINSHKPPYYLRNVLEEYQKVENEAFPHRACGYKTAQELLEKTGEFLFKTSPYNGEVIVSVKHSNKSAHIATMVRDQKCSKNSRMNKREESMRQLHQRFVSVPNHLNSRSNNQRHVLRHHSDGKNNQISHQQQQHQANLSSSAAAAAAGAVRRSADQHPFSSHKDGNSSAAAADADAAYMEDARDTINSKSKQQHNPSIDINESLQMPQSNNYLRPILGALKIANNVQHNGGGDGGSGTGTVGVFSKPQNQFQQNRNSFAFRNMQNFNNNNHNNKNTNNNNNNINNKLQQANGKQNQVISGKQDSIKALAKYCLTHGIPAPEYNVVTTKYPKLSYSCRVSVNNTIFSTYPIEYDSEYLAKEMCSKRALEKFILEDMKTPLPLSTFTDSEIVNKLLEELLTHSHGMFLKNIPEWFENKFQQSLPDHWADLIQTSKQFITEIGLNQKIIVFVNSETEETEETAEVGQSENVMKAREAETITVEGPKSGSVPATEPLTVVINSMATNQSSKMSPLAPPFVPFSMPTSSPSFVPTSVSSKSPSLQLPSIRFPWTEKCWKIFITYCVSTVEVWGRLFGSEYSERFNDLMDDIEDYMVLKKERPLSLIRQTIYLVCLSESWYRVRVDELDDKEDSALCYFIDFGDADWLEVNQLYICLSKFLELPPQAVPFSLYGLEDFVDHPGARKPLDDLLLTKSVVGMIFTKENEFYTAGGDKSMTKIQVILFDTSTQEDINLNHQLVQLICDDVSLAPQIKADTVNNVKITHICDNGDIYLQLMHNELKYVQKVIEQIVTVKLKANADDNPITLKDLIPLRLFLVCQDNNNTVNNQMVGGEMPFKKSWYRGTFVANSYRLSDNTCHMFDVDFGQTQRTHLSQIYNLERLSMALSKFPALALKVALYNIPDVTDDIAAHIRSLLPKDCEALVKLNVKSPVKPLVTIYSHLEGSRALCTINDIINIEYVLKKDEEKKVENSNSMKNIQNRKGIMANGIKRTARTESSNTITTNQSTITKAATNTFVDVPHRDLTLQMPPSPQSFDDDLPKLKEFHDIPKVGEYFQVRVTLSATPSNFTIQPYEEYSRLRTLMEELQAFCKSNDQLIPLDMIKVGEFYAAKNPDGLYHRAMVVKIYGGGDMIQVSFCDFGDTATLTNEQLKILPSKFRQLPQMALVSRLYGIRAAKDDWTLEDCLYFRKLTVGQTFVSIIKRIVNEPTADERSTCRILELELIDVSTDDDIFIHELFLKEKRAVKHL